ncbi:hypothetical protein ACFQX6_10915 [Streptosporangium lutulentum]
MVTMPVQQWRITQVREVSSPGEDAWLITYEPVDGDPSSGFASYVPKEAIEVRAAEYGLATVDEALDVILHAALLAPAHAAGELDMPAPGLLDVEAARAQVTEQLAICKERYGTITAAAAGPPARPRRLIRCRSSGIRRGSTRSRRRRSVWRSTDSGSATGSEHDRRVGGSTEDSGSAAPEVQRAG